MNIKFKKFTLSFLALLLVVFIIYSVLSHYNFFQNNLTIINDKIYSRSLPTNNFKSTYTSKINFNDMPVTNVNDITLNILDKKNIKNVPMLLKAQRYYIPVSFICNKLNYQIQSSDDSIILKNTEHELSLTETSYTKDDNTNSLRGNLLKKDNEYFISISDIEQLFDLIAVFDFDNKTISLLPNNIQAPEESSIAYTQKIAMIRFEDFTCGDSNFVDKNQTRVKCMVNLLYSQGIKFHVAWIPRFKAPTDNIDNDMLSNDNITNVAFIDLLDYMINKGGEIGLHGYTHQSGNDRSAVGEELSKDVNNTEEETKTVIENGIDTASALNIPITFYESPHYRDTELQKTVISQYFQFVFEPFDNNKRNIYKTKTNNLFVPTPLGFIQDPNDNCIVDGLNTNNPDVLHSFFYHPSIEVNFINFNTGNNALNVQYDENSPLQKMVKAIKDNGYTTVHIDELIKK